jgi:hypothetical protein
MAPQSFQLVMKSGPTPGKAFDLDKDEVFIGRDINNDVVINDSEVSRRHARLTRQAEGYLLEDLGSTNGTFVNGERLTRPYPLRPGETIMLGENVSLTYEGSYYDPDATIVGAPGPAAQAEPVRETYVPPTPRPAPPPAQRPAPAPPSYEPSFSGQVPPGPADVYAAPEEPRRKSRTWLIAGCGCLAVLLCVAAIASLFYIDAQNLWCEVLPFLPGCP